VLKARYFSFTVRCICWDWHQMGK